MKLKLVKTKEYAGYYLDDIRSVLTSPNYQKFTKWFEGQTGAIHNKKLLIYQWDFDKFLRIVGLSEKRKGGE